MLIKPTLLCRRRNTFPDFIIYICCVMAQSTEMQHFITKFLNVCLAN